MTKHEYISFGYLSGLKCHVSGLYNIDHTDNEKVNPITVEIVGVNLREVEIHEIGRTITEFYEVSDCFPILRPLSDLTAIIKEKNEYFIASERLCFSESTIKRILVHKEAAAGLSSFDLILLIQWHFDIAGLIEKGEAVDYHTLPDFVF